MDPFLGDSSWWESDPTLQNLNVSSPAAEHRIVSNNLNE